MKAIFWYFFSTVVVSSYYTGMAFLVSCKRIVRLPQTRFLTVTIYIVGKKIGSGNWLSEGINEYEKRLQKFMNVNTVFLKDDNELINKSEIGFSKVGKVFALDEYGKEYTSREFSDAVFKGFEEGGAQVAFVVGGFAGLPDEIRKKYPLISLSKLTWTHQFARLLLVEQIYRATMIHKGTPYHKD